MEKYLSMQNRKPEEFEEMFCQTNREKCVESLQEIRKKARFDLMMKNRHMDIKTELAESVIEELRDAVVAAANFENVAQQINAVKNMRLLIKKDKTYLINVLGHMEIVPVLMKCLAVEGNPKLQYEATYALTNYGNFHDNLAKAVIEAGFIPLLIQRMSSPSSLVNETACWSLGNIIRNRAHIRDMVLEYGILKPLLSCIKPDTKPLLLSNIVFTLSNICRCETTSLPQQTILEILPSMKMILDHHTNSEVLQNTLMAIRHLVEDVCENIGLIIEGGVVPKIVEMLGHVNVMVCYEGLLVVACILSGTNEQIDYVLNCGPLNYLPKLLRHGDKDIRKMACRVVSNIAGGNEQHLQSIIQSDLVGPMLDNLRTGPLTIQKEVAWTIKNFTYFGNREQVYTLLLQEAVIPFCALLDCDEQQVLRTVLRGLNRIIKLTIENGDGKDLGDLLIQCGAVNKIKKLQNNQGPEVQEFARCIVKKYFN